MNLMERLQAMEKDYDAHEQGGFPEEMRDALGAIEKLRNFSFSAPPEADGSPWCGACEASLDYEGHRAGCPFKTLFEGDS